MSFKVTTNRLEDFLFLFLDPSNKEYIGAGFLVQSGGDLYIITAAHVAADALGVPRTELNLSIDTKVEAYYPKEQIRVLLLGGNVLSQVDANDVAIFLPQHVPASAAPAAFARFADLEGSDFQSGGARKAGSRAWGQVLGYEIISKQPGRWPRLELMSQQLDGGMSGSPVIHTATGFVIGMTVSTWYSKTGKDEHTAYAVSTETIKLLLPEIQVNSITKLEYKLLRLAQTIINRHEKPRSGIDTLFGLTSGIFIDMPIWQYGHPFVDDTTVQFSWLSDEAKALERKKGMLSESVIEYLCEWVNAIGRQRLALLGEFGMGKSAVLFHLEYLLAKQYVTRQGKFPLRISLGHRRLQSSNQLSLSTRIRDYIEDYQKITFDLEEINRILEGENIVLLLDSFDEMPLALDRGNQFSNFRYIMQDVSNAENLKLIIASRDNYFFSGLDIKEVFQNTDIIFGFGEFEISMLRGFRSEEIRNYLKVRFGERSDQFWNKVKLIHDLPDLATRPILLVMMAAIEQDILAGTIRSRTQLYKRFVDSWLQRERYNGRIRLKNDRIIYILRLLAEKSTIDPSRSFSQLEVEKLLIECFGYSMSEAEDLGNDFRVCCFLGRDSQDYYRFLHNSFREFFFAEKLAEHIHRNDWSILRGLFLAKEVSHFLTEELGKQKDLLREYLNALLRVETGEDYLLTNTMALYELLYDQPSAHAIYREVIDEPVQEIQHVSRKVPANFVVIPNGYFYLGSWKGRPDETPVRKVFVESFALAKYPVTNREYLDFVSRTGYITVAERLGGGKIWTGGKWQYIEGLNWRRPRLDGVQLSDRLDHPVVQTAWEDAVAYCTWYANENGILASLPTEAEWEYACRAGSFTDYCYGDDEVLLSEYAWYKSNYDATTSTQPVGLKLPNHWGLYDMHGNVREWCLDVYDRYPGNNLRWDLGDRYYSTSGIPYHVLRGGHFGSTNAFLRSSIRVSGEPSLTTDYTGFRIKITIGE